MSTEQFREDSIAFYQKVKTATAEQKSRYMAATYPRNWKKKGTTPSSDSTKYSKPKRHVKRDFSAKHYPVELSVFDPNTADESILNRLGLPQRVVRTLIKFRSKGGRFYQAEDLMNIYGMRPDDYDRIEPFIQIQPNPLRSVYQKSTKPNFRKKIAANISINTADVDQWQALRGIGPAYSKRILKFREALGGFVSIDQVADTYGLPDSTFQQIKPFLKLDTPVKKLDVNQASEGELKAHPYISWKQAKVIIRYRDRHGLFTDFEAFKEVQVFKAEELERVKHYLGFGLID